MKVRLLCEGSRDGRIGSGDAIRGAAVVILDRLISDSIGRQLTPQEIRPGRLPKLTKGGGFRRKIELAICEADDDPDVDSLVVLVDRDKPEYNLRLSELEAGIEVHLGKPIAARTVAGMAIEELEAWLIADHSLLASKFPNSTRIHGKPEEVGDPKAEFLRVLRESGCTTFAEVYDEVASEMNLKTLEQRCRAFKRFADEVRNKLTER